MLVRIARFARTVGFALIVRIVTIAGMSYWKNGSSGKSCSFPQSLSERKRGSFRVVTAY